MALLLIISIVIGLFCLFYLCFGTQTNDPTSKTNDSLNEQPPLIIGDRFLILKSSQLIEVLELSPLLQNIQTNLGLSDENWHRDALPFLNNYIEFVQRLPASESHHHAGDGGLIKHTLDVAVLALIASTAQSWPPNAKTEDIAKKTSVWRFGIMCAAILHDIGKTITGFNIQLFEGISDHEQILWLPDAGSMSVTGKLYYRVDFPDKKSTYTSHAEIAWTFFQALVPVHVRQWIAATDPNLMLALRSYLSGKKDGSPFEKIITGADMASVSRDLKAGSRQRFSSAKRIPLIEIIMDTLREMLSDRGSYFSVATYAGGDIFHVDGYMYMMAKNVPDYIRQYLRNTQHRSAASFPSDNQRIFDTLLEYGAVIPTEQDPFRAVINVAITFTRSDGTEVSGVYSMLRFKANSLYPNENFPEIFKGKLAIASESKIDKSKGNEIATEKEHIALATVKLNTKEEKASLDYIEEIQEVKNLPDAKLLTKNLQIVPIANDIDDLLSTYNLIDESDLGKEFDQNLHKESNKIDSLSINKNSELTSRDTEKNPQKFVKGRAGLQMLNNIFNKQNEKGVSDSQINQDPKSVAIFETAQEGIKEIIQERMEAPLHTPRPVNIKQPQDLETITQYTEIVKLESEIAEKQLKVNKGNKTILNDSNSLEERKLEIRERGVQFLHWLTNGMADGSISVNQSGSPIHFIEQGMLLVSPAIFRDYAGGIFNKSDAESFGPLAQKGFEALKLHKRTQRTALFRAITTGTSKKLFYCYLIPEHNIKHIIQPSSRPANNTDITLDNSDLLIMEKKDESTVS